MQQIKTKQNIREQKVPSNSFLSRVASTCSSVGGDFLVGKKEKKKAINYLEKHL